MECSFKKQYKDYALI